MNLGAAWRALWGGSPSGARAPGRGAYYLPPGARMDYAREAGELHLNQVVAVVLGWIYDQLPSAQLRVGTMTADGEYEARDAHPLYDLCRRPNPFFGWQELLGATSGDFKIDGNAYWIKARDRDGRGNVRELYWAPNTQVTVVGSSDPRRGPIDRYDVQMGAQTVSYAPDDIVHLRDMPDPASPIMGLGRVKRQLRAVAGINAGDTLTAAALRNAHTGIVLVPKQDNPAYDLVGSPEKAAMDAEARAVKRSFGGEGFGGVRAANLPVEYVRVGYTPEELMLDRILDRPEAFLVSAMGSNPLVHGLPSGRDSRTYSNIAEARKAAWEDGIVPMQDAFAAAIQTQLVYARDPSTGATYGEFGDAEGLEVWWDRSEVKALQEDEEAQATRVVMIYNAGLIPKSRANKMLGIELTPAEEAELETEKQEAAQRQQDAFGAGAATDMAGAGDNLNG